jgi:hypothetical protein
MVGKRSTDAIFSIIIFGVASAFTEVNLITMPRGVLKENLPTKICIVCDRPFTIYADDPAKFGDDSLTLLGSVMGMRIATVDANSNPEETNAEGERGCNIKYQPEGSNGDEEETEVEENVDDDEKSQSCSISIDHDSTSPTPPLEHFDAKAQRKAEKKRKKAERRAQKMGQGDPTAGQKRCTLCDNSVNLLIRCTYDSSGEWVSRTNTFDIVMHRRTIKLCFVRIRY